MDNNSPNTELYKINSSWLPYKGTKVELVESDEPWYVNKQESFPIKVIKKNNKLNKIFYDNALIKSFNNNKHKIDPLVLLLCVLIIIMIVRRTM